MFDYLNEVILYVGDMDRAVRFWRDVMGFPVRFPADLADYTGQYWVVLNARSIDLVLHGGGQGRLGADRPTISFWTDDIQAARAHLVAHGVRVGEVRQPVPTSRVIDGFDPDGHRFSVVQRTAHGPD